MNWRSHGFKKLHRPLLVYLKKLSVSPITQRDQNHHVRGKLKEWWVSLLPCLSHLHFPCVCLHSIVTEHQFVPGNVHIHTLFLIYSTMLKSRCCCPTVWKELKVTGCWSPKMKMIYPEITGKNILCTQDQPELRTLGWKKGKWLVQSQHAGNWNCWDPEPSLWKGHLSHFSVWPKGDWVSYTRRWPVKCPGPPGWLVHSLLTPQATFRSWKIQYPQTCVCLTVTTRISKLMQKRNCVFSSVMNVSF